MRDIFTYVNDKEEPLRRFTTRLSGGRYVPASGPATICGVFFIPALYVLVDRFGKKSSAAPAGALPMQKDSNNGGPDAEA